MNENGPFFILANPRSGSSLLRIICDSHPNICIPPESGFMEWWYLKYQKWSISDSINPHTIDVFIRDLLTSKKFETWQFNIEVFKNIIRNELPKNYAELIACVYLSFGKQRGKEVTVWGDKNNYYIHKTEILNKLYPNAKYIHLVRDGRDVAVSYLALKNLKTDSLYAPKLPQTVEAIAEEWHNNNTMLLDFFNSIPKARIFTMTYEELLRDIKGTSQKITSFLGLAFDEEMLRYHEINKEYSIEPKATLDWKQKTLEAPDLTNIGKYKKMLSNDALRSFVAIAGPTLKYFQYE